MTPTLLAASLIVAIPVTAQEAPPATAPATVIAPEIEVDAAPASEPASEVRELEFFDTLELARLRAAQEPRPIVLVFGARWCGWCRKLEYETLADERVLKQGAGFYWVKVDVDVNRELAAAHQVRGLPHTAVISTDGTSLGSRIGFMTVDLMLGFLTAALDMAPGDVGPDGVRRPPTVEDRTRAIVQSLAEPQRMGRREQLSALRMLGDPAWRVLVVLMEHERLSVRAAAAGALSQLARQPLPFDPFASPDTRRAQLASWVTWVDANAGPLPVAEPVESPEPDED